ncbi:lactonase family protein [bacterium]|nr:MAG: lactonase family protein [bacterium]
MFKYLSKLLLLGCLAGASRADDLANQTKPTVQYLPANHMTLYIGTYTRNANEGICVSYFNPENGELSAPQTAVAVANPAFLAASSDGRFLYAVNEWGQVAGENKGGISAFRIEPGTNQLTALNSFAFGGNLCHLTMDATGKWLLAAAYSAGSISTWPIQEDGSIGPRAMLVQHTGSGPNQGRQKEAHAHHVVLSPDNRRAFVADLGMDKVTIDDFNAATGELTGSEPSSVGVVPGAGPRHIALSPSGKFLYVVSELNNTITAFKNADSTPEEIQVISTLPADFTGESFAAEIATSPDGRFLYTSNRGYNSVAAYSIEGDGQLKLVGFSPVGRNPRHFTFDPSGKWLLVGNQEDMSISVFSVDSETGALTQKHLLENIPGKPVCLLFGKEKAGN